MNKILGTNRERERERERDNSLPAQAGHKFFNSYFLKTVAVSRPRRVSLGLIFFCCAGFLFLIAPFSANASYLTTNQSADVVVGQSNFISNLINQTGSTTPGANGFYQPYQVFAYGNKLFTVELSNNRVLIFNSIPTTSNASADVVVGWPDFSSSVHDPQSTANRLTYPMGIFTNGEKLFIGDQGSNRILIYNSIPSTNNASADVVIGQVDFTHYLANQGGSIAANTLSVSVDAFTLGQKLFVVDKGNNRILIYNTIPTSNNASADVVIGQADFTHGLANQGGAIGPNTINTPRAVFSDGQKLFVDDGGNNRVLIFNSIPTTNNASADVVIGQVDFTHGSANQGTSVGADTLSLPIDVFGYGAKLYIADFSNNRVLVYNSIPTANNASADVVIGQPDFTSNSINQTGSTTVAGANTLYYPRGVCTDTDGQRLFIADQSNDRVLIYYLKISAPTVVTPQALSTTSIRWNFTSNDTIQTGFKLYDSSNNLLATSADANATYIDETGLSANTQYSGRYVQAYSNYGNSASSATASSVYTLANAPSTPTLTTLSSSSLNTVLDVNGNPADTNFAIYNSTAGKYLQADGTLGNSAVWQTYLLWGGVPGITTTGLSENTQYIYQIKAKNGDNIETASSTDVSKYTLVDTPTNFSASSNSNSVSLSVDSFPNNTSGQSGYYFSRSGGGNSGWIQTNSWTDTGLSCGNSYTYYVKYRNGDGTETSEISTTKSTSGCGGGGMPAGWSNLPITPIGGFKVLINNGANSTNNSTVTLSLTAGSDVKNMAISNFPDFAGAGQEPFQPTKTWTLTSGNGTKAIYVKFYTIWGRPSEIVQDTILYTNSPSQITNAQNNAALIAQIKQQLISLITQLIQMLYLQISQMA